MKPELVVAVSRNGVIGNNGELPWHLPADLRHFKELTTGHAVIMGRKTHESIMARNGKPLPNRTSIVISRNPALATPDEVVLVPSLDEAIQAWLTNDQRNKQRAFVIGGAQIYAKALGRVDTIHLTRIEAEFEGDALFPDLDIERWFARDNAYHTADEQNPHDYRFITYGRRWEDA